MSDIYRYTMNLLHGNIFPVIKKSQSTLYQRGNDYEFSPHFGGPRNPPQELLDIFHRFHAGINDIIEFSQRTNHEAGFVVCEKNGTLYKMESVYSESENTLSGLKKCIDANTEGFMIVHTHPEEIVSGVSGPDASIFAFSQLKYFAHVDTIPNPRKKNQYHVLVNNRDKNTEGTTFPYEWYDKF